MYEAKLVVTDDMGCRDTAYRQIWVGEEYYMYVPNSFTPDSIESRKVWNSCVNGSFIKSVNFHEPTLRLIIDIQVKMIL